MNAVEVFAPHVDASLDAAIDTACRAVAPTWPLDRFIAVNPYWGLVDRPIAHAAAAIARLSGSPMWMPHAFYRQACARGRFEREHLAQAAAEAGVRMTADELLALLDRPAPPLPRLPLPSDILDAKRDLQHAPAWRDTITHQISQFCAAHFDADQADWRPERDGSLFAAWRNGHAEDRSIALLMDAPEVGRRVATLPDHPRQAIAATLAQLDIPADRVVDVLTAALLRIGGWAAWCAYLRWQARLEQGDDDTIVDVLAIRLAWEALLDDGARHPDSVWSRWQRALQAAPASTDAPELGHLGLYQRALELAYQAPLATALARARPSVQEKVPEVQAVFCIDVRSEVFRRALEGVAPQVQTMGFAGFFGLPISYAPLGTYAARPQLPGLLAPALHLTDTCGSEAVDRALDASRRQRLAARRPARMFGRMPASAFSLVEALGLGYVGKLIHRSLPATSALSVDRDGLSAEEAARARPRLVLHGTDAVVRQALLAEQVLRAMSLTYRFARLVLLAGHGSRSANNPHAAGLDCGACCGQTGEVNARVLAALLNNAAVRGALATRGLIVPQTTYFLATLHNTTIDEVELFDVDEVPASHASDLASVQRMLAAAGERARAERAPALGLSALVGKPAALHKAVLARAVDWAQTRPEWALANNAAFIVGPRVRSRGIDLGGRAFLHDYDWQRDTDGSVLELIMTAPMVVTHWINMQYNASTTDNLRYGSGNKVLHNVVGGRIGVFEGNGGDLRIGLPLQSLHDGQRWMHTPQRLSVFIEAPRAGIEVVIAKHQLVRQLLDHSWLFLFRIDPQTSAVEAYHAGRWMLTAAPERDR